MIESSVSSVVARVAACLSEFHGGHATARVIAGVDRSACSNRARPQPAGGAGRIWGGVTVGVGVGGTGTLVAEGRSLVHMAQICGWGNRRSIVVRYWGFEPVSLSGPVGYCLTCTREPLTKGFDIATIPRKRAGSKRHLM